MQLSKELRNYIGLPKSIYVLFFARIINSMGAFVFPFLTMFLTENLGLGEKQSGLIVFISAMSFVPGSIIGGILSDNMGRKKILIIFQSLAAICFIPCAFLGNSMVIPVLLILAGVFGGAAQPANSAMVADLTNSNNRKNAFSLLYLGINIGFAFGPLIAGFLYNNYIELIFIGDALTTMISLLLVFIYVEESLPSDEDIELGKTLNSDEKTEEGNLISVLFKRPALLAFAVVSTIYSFVFAQHTFALPLQINSIYGADKLGPKVFGTLMMTNGVVVVIMTLFLTSITKKLRPILNIAISGILCSIGFGIIFFIKDISLFILSTAIWTLGEILNVTNSGVYIANHAPMSHRGRFNSILPIITGSGWALSPLIMGGFIEDFGVINVWPLTALLALIGSILMSILFMIEKKKIYNTSEIKTTKKPV